VLITQEIIFNSTVPDQQNGAYATELYISFALPSLKTLLHWHDYCALTA
jgi:hypothetical protein